MGWFVVRRGLAVRGGKIQFGADVELARTTADRLDLADALQVSGTANITGATRVGGALTQVGAATLSGALSVAGSATLSGTPCVLPYLTASPGDAVNGEFNIYHKGDVARLSFRSGGTPYTIALPSATHGTVTITIGSPP